MTFALLVPTLNRIVVPRPPREEVRQHLRADKGTPARWPAEAPNRYERLGSKARAVSVMEKAGAPVRWGLER